MDVKIIFLEFICKFRIEGLHKSNGNLGGLFHHISKLSGNDHLSIAFCKRSFDKKDFSTSTGPGKTGYNSRHWVFQNLLMMNSMSQKFCYTLLTYRNALLLTLYQLHSCISA